MLSRSALLALALLAAAPALAQAPRLIPYQGVLTDGGAPVTSATNVTFSLFDVASGGAALWTETQSVTPDANGVFAVQLGSVSDLDDLSFGDPLWLEVSVGGAALGPRTALGAVPYALAMYGVRVTPPTSTGDAPSIVAGHPSNSASGRGAVVAGGGFDSGSSVWPNTASGLYATVSGGRLNTASGSRATLGGGADNTASGVLATVGGGTGNTAGGYGSTVGGGTGNTATGSSPTAIFDGAATIGGGSRNTATGRYSTVGGGDRNNASGERSTVPGGILNHTRGDFSFAAGYNARAIHRGTFVWSEPRNQSDSLLSTAANQFLIRASGGVGIGTNQPLGTVHIARTDLGVQASALENEAIVVEHEDAVIGLYSSAALTWGSALSLGEVTGTGTLANKWTMQRNTGASGALHFTFGTSDNYGANNTVMRIDTDGTVHADASFTGGGADFAEWLPLASSSHIPRAGDVVGVSAGRVGLATDGAEQVMVVSSNPAFVGNPEAEDGGVLVALVGQAEVRLASPAEVGDLLVASGREDGTARAVSPARYSPATDGVVIGRVLALAEDGMAIALVGIDEAAALRDVVVRQQEQMDAQQSRLDAQQAQIDALVRRLNALDPPTIASE